jgi:hypothetical protein
MYSSWENDGKAQVQPELNDHEEEGHPQELFDDNNLEVCHSPKN